ncbi:MAG: SDR family NAD(P)-dependent oxidoreductase [Saprospiraceae bacterium]
MQGKHIVVVGGSTGIGKAITEQLAAQGANVLVLSRESHDLNIGGNVSYQSVDVVNDDLKSIDFPAAVDGLVYCPGSINLKMFRSLKVEDFRRDLEINVLGAVKALQAVLRPMKKSGAASVVLFSTVAVGQGMPFHASVAAAKGAVEGLAKSLAAELAPKIRVNCIAPSLTDTPMAANLLSSDDKKEASNKRHPLRRFGQPADIANMATFLLSEQSSWVTGQVIGVDGGMSTLRA